MRCVFGLTEDCEAVNLIFGESGSGNRVDFKGKTDEQVVMERYISALIEAMGRHGLIGENIAAKVHALQMLCQICPYRLEQLPQSQEPLNIVGHSVGFSGEGEEEDK